MKKKILCFSFSLLLCTQVLGYPCLQRKSRKNIISKITQVKYLPVVLLATCLLLAVVYKLKEENQEDNGSGVPDVPGSSYSKLVDVSELDKARKEPIEVNYIVTETKEHIFVRLRELPNERPLMINKQPVKLKPVFYEGDNTQLEPGSERVDSAPEKKVVKNGNGVVMEDGTPTFYYI